MRISATITRKGAHAAAFALAVVCIAACGPSPSRDSKLATATDTTGRTLPQMPMAMPANGQAGMRGMGGRAGMGGMSGCPLGLKSLSLTPAQKATFDSVRSEHKAAMQSLMQASLARARAVLTPAQRASFDSASSAHMARMAQMEQTMGGGCMN